MIGEKTFAGVERCAVGNDDAVHAVFLRPLERLRADALGAKRGGDAADPSSSISRPACSDRLNDAAPSVSTAITGICPSPLRRSPSMTPQSRPPPPTDKTTASGRSVDLASCASGASGCFSSDMRAVFALPSLVRGFAPRLRYFRKSLF